MRNVVTPAFVLALCLGAPAFAETPQSLFADNCSACHQVTGKGVPGAFPALAGDKFVLGDPTPMIHVVLNGRAGMPSFKADLTDADIAGIVSYVRGAWGNKAKPVTAAEVAAVRSAKAPAKKLGLQAH